MKKDYVVKRAGYFYGAYYPVGKVLALHPKQAYYELLLGNLAPYEPAAAPASAEVPRIAVQPPAAPPRRRRVSVSTRSL